MIELMFYLYDHFHPMLHHFPSPIGGIIFGLIFGLPVGVFIYALGWLLNPFKTVSRSTKRNV